jgi:tRNA (cmo5U34)-methyltransferase
MSESKHETEKMADFFDQRSQGYDQHMRRSIKSFQAFYEAVAGPIKPTGKKIRVLDLGSGTGLALGSVFEKAPRAVIVAVDLSKKMLERLQEKYRCKKGQIKIVNESYLDLDFPQGSFDYVMAVMTLHHFPPEQKVSLYRDIRKWLKDNGIFIEGDYITPSAKEEESLNAYRRLMKRLKNAAPGLYHIDVPLSLKTQCNLLTEAGFEKVETVWHEEEAAVLAGKR